MLADGDSISDLEDDIVPLDGPTPAAMAAPAGDGAPAADAGDPTVQGEAPDAETVEADDGELEAHAATLAAAEAEAEAVPDPSTLLLASGRDAPASAETHLPTETDAVAPEESKPSEQTLTPAPTAEHGVSGGDEIEEEAHLAPPPKMDREGVAVYAEEEVAGEGMLDKITAGALAGRAEVFQLTETTEAAKGGEARVGEAGEQGMPGEGAEAADEGFRGRDVEAMPPIASGAQGDAPVFERVDEPTPSEGSFREEQVAATGEGSSGRDGRAPGGGEDKRAPEAGGGLVLGGGGGGAEAAEDDETAEGAELRGRTEAEGGVEAAGDAELAGDVEADVLGGVAERDAGEAEQGDAEAVAGGDREALATPGVGGDTAGEMGDGDAWEMDGGAAAGEEGRKAETWTNQGVGEDVEAEEEEVEEGGGEAEDLAAEEREGSVAGEASVGKRVRSTRGGALELDPISPRSQMSNRGSAGGAAVPTKSRGLGSVGDGGAGVEHAPSKAAYADAAAEARALADAAKAAALASAVAEAQTELDQLRAAVPSRDPRQGVAEQRRRRDALRGQTNKLRVQLEQLSAERLASERKLERLTDREVRMAGSSHRLGLPAAPMEVSEEEVRGIKEEIKRLTAMNSEMEMQAPVQDEARFHIEKLQNERKHVQRRLRSFRAEVRAMADEASRATAELNDLHTRCVPSELARKLETKMGVLKGAIAAENAARVVAEREMARKLRRVLRVRAALSGFLAQHGVGYADVNADEHAAPLAAYVLDASSQVRERTEQASFLSAKVEVLRESYVAAAAELTRLVAARGRAQRRRSPLHGATPSLGADSPDPLYASADGASPAQTGASVGRLRQARVGASRGVLRRTWGSLAAQLTEALASESETAALMGAFELCDPSGTGFVTRADFLRALVNLGFDASKREIDATFETLDTAKTGRMPYHELARLLAEAPPLPPPPPKAKAVAKPPASAIRPEKLKPRVRPVVSTPVPLLRKAGATGNAVADSAASGKPSPRAVSVSRKVAPMKARKPGLKKAKQAGAAVESAEGAQPTGATGAADLVAGADVVASTVVEGADDLGSGGQAEGTAVDSEGEGSEEAAGVSKRNGGERVGSERESGEGEVMDSEREGGEMEAEAPAGNGSERAKAGDKKEGVEEEEGQAGMEEDGMEALGMGEAGADAERVEETETDAAVLVEAGTGEAGADGAEVEGAGEEAEVGEEAEEETAGAGELEVEGSAMTAEEAAVKSGGETDPSPVIAATEAGTDIVEDADQGLDAAAATSTPEGGTAPEQDGQADNPTADAPLAPARSSETAVASDFEDDLEEDLDLA